MFASKVWCRTPFFSEKLGRCGGLLLVLMLMLGGLDAMLMLMPRLLAFESPLARPEPKLAKDREKSLGSLSIPLLEVPAMMSDMDGCMVDDASRLDESGAVLVPVEAELVAYFCREAPTAMPEESPFR